MRLHDRARGVEDDELVAVDEADRAAACTEQGGRTLDEGVCDVRLSHGRGERRRELLERLHLPRRLLRSDGRGRGELLRASHDDADPHDHERDRERNRPAQDVVARVEARLGSRGDEQERTDRPADAKGHESGQEPAVPDGDGHRADEERVDGGVGERHEHPGEDECGQRAEDRNAIAHDRRSRERAVASVGGSLGRSYVLRHRSYDGSTRPSRHPTLRVRAQGAFVTSM